MSKQVIRFKCDFCQRVYAKIGTAEMHERECCKNPNGVNCFICEHADMDGDYRSEFSKVSEPYCTLHEEFLRDIKVNAFGTYKSYAPMCSDFKRVKNDKH
jgi:hypothetical protein